jgi:hypothetical protein
VHCVCHSESNDALQGAARLVKFLLRRAVPIGDVASDTSDRLRAAFMFSLLRDDFVECVRDSAGSTADICPGCAADFPRALLRDVPLPLTASSGYGYNAVTSA